MIASITCVLVTILSDDLAKIVSISGLAVHVRQLANQYVSLTRGFLTWGIQTPTVT